MAEGFLQSLDNRITVRSAGTNATGKLNPKAVEVMKEAGIDISHHTSKNVDLFLNEAWDYVITVCGGAKETCPLFTGRVNHRVHIGFEDPSEVVGTPEFIDSKYRRIRDEIKTAFQKFYDEEIKPQL
jgi:arsenate reductase